MLKEKGLNFVIEKWRSCYFYGPKLEFHGKDALGRSIGN